MQFTINYFQKQSPGGVVLKSFTKFKKKNTCEFCEVFKNTFFHRIPLLAASVFYEKVFLFFSFCYSSRRQKQVEENVWTEWNSRGLSNGEWVREACLPPFQLHPSVLFAIFYCLSYFNIFIKLFLLLLLWFS